MNTVSTFLIGGTASGSGKTTLTLGIMAALKARGLAVQPFKCGPDFIDPSLHRMVTDRVSSNLDLRMCGRSFCEETFRARMQDKDVGVVEGVMGLFDGGEASSAALATALDLPVLLVVDCRSAGESVAAVIKGFEEYQPGLRFCGVICNRVGSSRHEELIRHAVEAHCQTPILGFFPRDFAITIPDRHLGLYMGEEAPLDEDQLHHLVDKIIQHCDLDRLLELTRTKPVPHFMQESAIPQPSSTPLLAVARDKAFCFYYEDNLRILEEAGAELVAFSPLDDRTLPAGCQGVYLGGGYPELYADRLSENQEMQESIRRFAAADGIIYAECGGFMYLCKEIQGLDADPAAMCNIFPFRVRMRNRFSRLGYRHPLLVERCFWGERGEQLHGHEFHYSELVHPVDEVETLFVLEDGRREGYRRGNVIGGYIHLHFGRSRGNVENFVRALSRQQPFG